MSIRLVFRKCSVVVVNMSIMVFASILTTCRFFAFVKFDSRLWFHKIVLKTSVILSKNLTQKSSKYDQTLHIA